ncbi:TonB-dependent receptor [Saccharicrinis sp. 156]|uniref:TonB-dependent receptor n=1 Tax=Saccharicrinis sp. 156 TaxID=3417574 RepID=UPI003D359349
MLSFRILLGINIVFLFTGILSDGLFAQGACSIVGELVNSETNQPVPYCAIQIEDGISGSMSNESGMFKITAPCAKHVKLVFSSLSFEELDTIIFVNREERIFIKLKPTSLSLPDIKVIANVNSDLYSSYKIKQTAIQHIQPSGLSDLLQLLPGNLIEEPDLSQPNYISIRQVDSDNNTAIGTSIVIDGIPISDDGNMQQPYGTDISISQNTSTANGLDLRQFSTDEIESVEVITGIPSAKYGDLTSGVVVIQRKEGVSPLEVRAKTDINNKLLAIGKGIALPKKGGVLNIGFDYLNYVSDPRNSLNNYQRITSSLRHKRKFIIDNKTLTTKIGVSLINTLDKEKEDPEINSGVNDLFNSDYKKISASLQAAYYANSKWLDKLAFNFSASQTQDKIVRDKFIALNGPTPQPISTTEGVSKGIYLPSQYQADLQIEGKPVDVFVNIEFSKKLYTKGMSHLLNLGGSYTSVKNNGKGETYDSSRPPFVGTLTGRPRDFRSIPALQKMFYYAEDKIMLALGNWEFTNQIGVRSNQLINLSEDYSIKGKIYIDPRLNLNIKLPEIKWINNGLNIWVGAGYGNHTKLPMSYLMYTYPVYIDIIELNYFSQNPDLRTLYTRTYIMDRTNYALKPSRNKKKELSLRIEWNNFKLKSTVFHERSTSGYSSNDNYYALIYNKYDASSVSSEGLTEPPGLNEFTFEKDTGFYYIDIDNNAALVDKKGVEYSIEFPKINPLKTNISINGAWFKTEYGTSELVQSRPSVILNNEEYPYVGVYNIGGLKKGQFNSNVRFDTHIPLLRLIYTINAQLIWYSDYERTYRLEHPVFYFDKKGQQYPYLEGDEQDYVLRHLNRSYSSIFYQKQTIPFSMDLHMKMTKEIGDRIKIAFYVNRFLGYYTPYTSNNGKYYQRSTNSAFGPQSPYFGAEIKYKIK